MPNFTATFERLTDGRPFLTPRQCQTCSAALGRQTRFCTTCGATAPSVLARGLRPFIPSRARAGLLRRIIAEIIDRFIPLPFLAYFFPEWVWVVIAYHLICDGTPSGRSIGKTVCRLRVVSVGSLEPCGLIRSLVRRLGPALGQAAYCWWEMVPLALAYDLFSLAVMWLNPSSRRLEDYLAGTQVVTEGAYRQLRQPCPSCRELVLARSRYCPHCGTNNEPQISQIITEKEESV
jgi:uncharacterized RDD family membrane protein YckC